MEASPVLRTAPVAQSQEPPLAVDLDGTLLRTDLLMEGLALGLARKPVSTLLALPLAIFNRALLKAQIAKLTPDLAVELLPVNERFLAFLQKERSRGRALHLVTASDQVVAARVAQRIGVFDSVAGSDGVRNLKGNAKSAALQRRFPGGFAYAGDSFADLPVWAVAASAIFVGWKTGVVARLRKTQAPLAAAFIDPGPTLRDWSSLAPPRCWLANLLIFAPLGLSDQTFTPQTTLACLAAFLQACLLASAGRLLDEATCLEDQRRGALHPSPFARGALPLAHGLSAAAALTVAGLALAAWQTPLLGLAQFAFAASLLAHYKFATPSRPMADLLAVVANQLLRLLVGLVAVGS